MLARMRYPTTPDGRYFVVRGRLWRCANPSLAPDERARLTRELMAARRAVRTALAQDDTDALRAARKAVDAAKVALGERGPVWWTDGAPDVGRRMARNTAYAAWYATVGEPVPDDAPAPHARRRPRGVQATSRRAPPSA
ncbi:hypothetical protein [Lysobacter humi (ex Lee et al. 2017)]